MVNAGEKKIEIKPVTRLEGHGNITIMLDKNGKVKDARFDITTVRFFEKFLEGRRAEDAPIIAPRICGICPEPHHLASVKAVEAAWGIDPPKAAKKLRDLLIQGKQIASHGLHFYALAAPDFVLGPFASPSARNVVTVINKLPDVGKKALELMHIGQELCAIVGGKAIHPVTALPGGMSKPLKEDQRDYLLTKIGRAIELSQFTLELAKKVVTSYWDVVTNLAVVDTYCVGLVRNGAHDIFDGSIRVMAPNGKIEVDSPGSQYLDFLGEYVLPTNYVTHVFYKPAGYPAGIWRAGPLARVNVADKMTTPLAQSALEEFRDKAGRPCHATFAYHWARVIELLAAAEKARALLEDADIVNTDVKIADIKPKEGNGVGVVEAPRGTLIHNYWSDKEGVITKANLIVATNNNIGAIDKCLKAASKQLFEEKVHLKLKLPTPMVKT
nr:Ni/Fe hydrogenase subunit alpha [Candidatus Njordarchaeota archaeon]